MKNVLFLQSEVENPFDIYAQMQKEHPLHWDETNQIWAVYSYEHCLELFNSKAAEIPELPEVDPTLMNGQTRIILKNLVRLRNAHQHQKIRPLVLQLFQQMDSIQGEQLLEQCEVWQSGRQDLEWVDTVCQKLPAWSILKGFGMDDHESELILKKVGTLPKMMWPQKSEEDWSEINGATKIIYPLIEKFLVESTSIFSNIQKVSPKCLDSEELLSILVSNFIGFLIQSYDAGRGGLSNAMLQVLTQSTLETRELTKQYFQKHVVETLRFSPPIHNTRRVLTKDLILGDTLLKKGSVVLLVLAAANRDERKFNDSEHYQLDRINNGEHLTFGTGGHMCMANHFSVHLVSETLHAFFSKYSKIELMQHKIEYEAMVNARLPKQIHLSLSN